jgi:HK97 family phage portal protein
VKIFGFDFSRKGADLSIDQVIKRLEAAYATSSGVVVTAENCEESPTVQAIVNAISMRIATLPVHVYQKKTSNNRESKELLPSHPVARLLQKPNDWQTPVNYWMDATSCLVRHGRYCSVKARGVTGPIRALLPVHPSNWQLDQGEDLRVTARVTSNYGNQRDYALSELHLVRGRARDFLNGDSPVMLAREAIALEIAAQRFGAAFFGNGAMPGLIFSYMQGVKGHTSKEQRDDFLQSFNSVYGKTGSFKALFLPAGIDKPEQLNVENDKAQFLETRKLQRSVIAGAFGVPPHLTGDLERATFSNIEQMSSEFVEKVVLPYVRMFESAMERDLLTDEDRRSGVVVRFNLDAALRADFKGRQEGLKIQREMGVISADDWRENENMNPLPPGKGGDVYWQQGPSGQNGGAENAQQQAQRPT